HYEGEEFDNRSCAGVRFSGVDNVGKRQNEICEFRAPPPELKVLIEASCGDGGAQGIASQNITRYAAEPKREVSKRHPKPAHRQVEIQALAPSRLVERRANLGCNSARPSQDDARNRAQHVESISFITRNAPHRL